MRLRSIAIIGITALLVAGALAWRYANVGASLLGLATTSTCSFATLSFPMHDFPNWSKKYHEYVSKRMADVMADADKRVCLKEPMKDIAVELLEWLHTYECALKQQEIAVSVQAGAYAGDPSDPQVNVKEQTEEQSKRSELIAQERVIARLALHRGMILMGGINRLRPLTNEIRCLTDASFKLRNVFGLLGDSLSCISRATDAFGSIRDLAP